MIKKRFYEVMDALGVSDYYLYTNVEGITKGMLVTARREDSVDISLKVLEPFCATYPNVNANYIMRGDLPMFLDNTDAIQREPEAVTDENMVQIIKELQQDNRILRNQIAAKDQRIQNLTDKLIGL